MVGGLVWAAEFYLSVIPSHDKLGISSTTASPLLNSTGRTREFGYHS